MYKTKMAGKTAKLNCTMTNTITTKTTDTKTGILPYEHWSTEKGYKRQR